MKAKKIYICKDSIEGIFTAIFEAWSSRYGHDNIRIEEQGSLRDGFNIELFSEYIYVNEDDEKALKVAKAIKEKISDEAYEMVSNAVLSDTEGKGDAIYRFLIIGFAMGPKVVDNLGNDAVMKLFTMNRNVGNEAHHILGFLRFKEINGNILLAKLNPKNDIIRIIAPHFSDRFGLENFIIYDEKRKTAILHQSGCQWIYTPADDLKLDTLEELSEHEEKFQQLWKTFFQTIAIDERTNPALQRNNLPKRFRGNMLEFGNNN